jgi:hypothetical protein
MRVSCLDVKHLDVTCNHNSPLSVRQPLYYRAGMTVEKLFGTPPKQNKTKQNKKNLGS